MEFIQDIDRRIQHEIAIRATADPRVLTGLRNLKTDFEYATSKSDKSEVEIIKALAKGRKETSEIYKNVNTDLYMQEIIELSILQPYLPEEITYEQVIDFLNENFGEKEMKFFKKYQDACENEFGQKVDSAFIKSWINR